MAPPPTSSLSSSAQDKINSFLRTQVEEKNIPTCVLRVLKADSELFSTSVGDADKDTVIRLFSMSKLITSVSFTSLFPSRGVWISAGEGSNLRSLYEMFHLASSSHLPFLVPSSDHCCIFFARSFTLSLLQIAVLRLIEQGRLSLDTEAGTFLPGLVAPRLITGHSAEGEAMFVPAQNKFTILQLLNHSSGLSRDKYSVGG